MKKQILCLALGVMALSACTSEDIIDVSVQSNAIGFENAVMKQSRAGDQAVSGDLTNANLDKFIVYGFYTRANETANPIQVFSGDAVTKGTDGKWTYKNTRFWVPGASYNFFAYSCADIALDNTFGTVGLDLNASYDNRQLIISSFRCDKRHNHDLIYAQMKGIVGQDKTEENPTPNANVSFNFEHVLTKVDAIFTSEFSEDYDIVIKDVKIVNYRNIGNFAKTSGWTDVIRVKDSETMDIDIQLVFPGENGEGIAKAGNAAAGITKQEPKTSTVYMIPYHYVNNDVQLTFTIELYKGTEHTKENLILSRPMVGSWSPNWELGKYYTYNIRLTGTAASLQPIVFQTSTDMNLGWSSGASTATDISFSAN